MARWTWRDDLRPRVAEVIARVGRDDMKALRAALREAYPFGDQKGWLYKVWCSEFRTQLGLLTPTETAAREAKLRDEFDFTGKLF